jgi:dephospho-CoA kinase
MFSSVITGGVGCGKSSASSMLRAHLGGVEQWFSADECTQKLLGTPEVIEMLENAFGCTCFDKIEGQRFVNRSRLREIIFRDTEARKKLERIIHPMVITSLDEQRTKAMELGCDFFLAEVPLHYEVEYTVKTDLVIVVAASRSMQKRRLMERRGLDDEIIENILRSQWPIEVKVENADVVIWNDGDFSALEAQVLSLARQFSLP